MAGGDFIQSGRSQWTVVGVTDEDHSARRRVTQRTCALSSLTTTSRNLPRDISDDILGKLILHRTKID